MVGNEKVTVDHKQKLWICISGSQFVTYAMYSLLLFCISMRQNHVSHAEHRVSHAARAYVTSHTLHHIRNIAYVTRIHIQMRWIRNIVCRMPHIGVSHAAHTCIACETQHPYRIHCCSVSGSVMFRMRCDNVSQAAHSCIASYTFYNSSDTTL